MPEKNRNGSTGDLRTKSGSTGDLKPKGSTHELREDPEKSSTSVLTLLKKLEVEPADVSHQAELVNLKHQLATKEREVEQLKAKIQAKEQMINSSNQ